MMERPDLVAADVREFLQAAYRHEPGRQAAIAGTGIQHESTAPAPGSRSSLRPASG